MKHRNSQKRIYGDYVYFITCNIDAEMEFFQNEMFCELWIKELKLCKELHKFKLYAFCLNYNHFHLLLKSENAIANYSEIMRFFKRNFARDANKIMRYSKWNDRDIPQTNECDIPQTNECDIPQTNECDIPQCRIHLGDDRDRHLRGHREYIFEVRQIFITKYGNDSPFPKFRWQKSFYDHIIRNQQDFDEHWNYTMNNFRKHGLPDDWLYTGLNFTDLIDEMNCYM